jgi:hypothetical protein
LIDFTGYATNVVISDLWGDPIKMPSGKVLVPISLRSTADARTIGLFLETTNSGSTWTIGTPFADRVGSGTFPGSGFNELNPVLTEVGASDATTKLVVLARAVSHGYWIHFRSSDGGSTWTEDVTNAFGYSFDNWGGVCAYGSPSQIPISSRLHYDGNVWSVIGYRGYAAGLNHLAVVSLKLSASDFFNNTYNPPSGQTYMVVPESDVYNNDTNNDVIHFGYTMLFWDATGKLWCHYYDESDPSSGWLNGDIKTRLMQVKITD